MNNVTCDICNELCSVSELKVHQKMHIHKDGFKCVICHAIVTTKYCLRRHVNLHFRHRSYKCQCGKIFYDSSNLTQHEKVCTFLNGSIDYPKVCRICHHCGRTFSNNGNLNRHLKVHSRVVNHKLNKPSDQKQQTGRNRGINTDIKATKAKDAVCNERSHICRKCGKGFGSISNLKRHLYYHKKLNKPSDQKQQTGGSRGINTDIKTTIPKDAVCNERSHICKRCGKGFSSISNLKRHLNAIPRDAVCSERSNICKKCGKSFSRVSNLIRHLEEVHNKLNKPSDQEQQTGGSRGINTDIKTTIPKVDVCSESSNICKKCGKSFSRVSNLKIHLEEVHNKLNKPRVCRICCHHCGRTFSKTGNLNRHLKLHSRVVNLKLSKPSDQKQQTGGSRGINTDIITTILKVDVCNESSNICKKCGKSFSHVGNLKRHLEEVHNKLNKPSVCRICHHCGRTFSNNGHLYQHLKVHSRLVNLKLNKPSDQTQQTGGSRGINTDIITTIPKDTVCSERSHICRKCGKGFGSISNLKRHLYFHKKLNKPSDQKQRTSGRRGINTDIKTTIPKDAVCNESSNICKKCGKGFSIISNLKRHLHFHIKKKYRCSHCERTCYSYYNLQKHLKVHSPTRNQNVQKKVVGRNKINLEAVVTKVCSICGKRFGSISQLKRHLEEVHNVKKNTYRCSHCAYTCNYYCNFKRHLKIHSPTRNQNAQKQVVGIPTINQNVQKQVVGRNKVNRDAVVTKVCSICGKRFANISGCKRHMLIHLDLRPYKCLNCGIGYNDKSSLNRHMCHSGIPKLDHKPSTPTSGMSTPSTSLQDKQSSYVFTLLEYKGIEKACLKSENINGDLSNGDLSETVGNNYEQNITECNKITIALQTGNVTDDCARVMEPCKIEEMTT